MKTCTIQRDAVIYPFNGRKKQVYLQQLSEGDLELYTNRASANAPFWEFQDSNKVSLNDIRRIDLKPIPKEEEYNKLTVYEKRFLGRYNLKVSHHKGILTLYRRRNGRLGGMLQFTNWGNRRPEHLYAMRVNGGKIRFRRSCSGRSCARIGATQAINQKFMGKLSSNRRAITGSYSGGYSGSRWSAIRK